MDLAGLYFGLHFVMASSGEKQILSYIFERGVIAAAVFVPLLATEHDCIAVHLGQRAQREILSTTETLAEELADKAAAGVRSAGNSERPSIPCVSPSILCRN